jgi:MoaA/NifB/PqqE/SkfB family radical SAM enzyme
MKSNRILYIQLNLICNSQCIFCYSDILFKDNFISKEIEYNLLLKEIKKFNLGKNDYVLIDGGEPTLYEHLPQLLNYLNKKNAYVKLFTNGRLFKKEKYAEILLKNISEIIIPIYGHTARIHDTITRSVGSFNETLSGINNICKLKRRKISKLKIVMNLVFSKIGLMENLKILSIFSKKFPQIDSFALNTLILSKTAIFNKNTIVPTQSELKKAIYAFLNFAYQKKLISYITNISVPYCIIPSKYIKYFTSLSNFKNVYYYTIDPIFPFFREQEKCNTKNDICTNCNYRNICGFDIKSYLEL